MTKVFIGGSRRLSKLNEKVTKALDKFVEKDLTVLIGDANGADRAAQSYLLAKGYRNVIVFCMKHRCRNNLGDWQIRYIETLLSSNNFKFYSTKDMEMVKETDYGFMLWDSNSKGTLNNIINLLKESKPSVVYFSPTKALYKVDTYDDLTRLLERCDKSSLDKFEQDLKLSKMVLQPTLWSSCKEVKKEDVTVRLEK